MEDLVRRTALAFLAERYPLAELGVVAGSSASVRRPRSDIDLLVIGPADMFPGTTIESAYTERFHGELLEGGPRSRFRRDALAA